MICLISLGCAKNTVDTERILARFVRNGFMIAANPQDADLCLLNTCGFIEAARLEVREMLDGLLHLRDEGVIQAVVAMGCMVERAAGATEQAAVLEGADALIGFGDYQRMTSICRDLLKRKLPPQVTPLPNEPFATGPRLRIGALHSAYLKIAEGCSNHCAYCTIPSIRGEQVSVPIEELVREAHEVIDCGAREIVLIAQDTSGYGRDLYGEQQLPALLHALTKEIKKPVWFRLMYAYPHHLDDAILDALAADPRCCPYIDLPLQHISDPILQLMGRRPDKRGLLELLDRIHAKLPAAMLRTTFIVGFPGETEQQFDELLQFVREGRFLHLGAFTYSHEQATPAAEYEDDVPQQEKEQRLEALMQTQLEVSRKHLAAWVGHELTVMLDEPLEQPIPEIEGATWVGRAAWQAPEVDGNIFIRQCGRHAPGDRITVRIAQSLDYDLVAEGRNDQ